MKNNMQEEHTEYCQDMISSLNEIAELSTESIRLQAEIPDLLKCDDL